MGAREARGERGVCMRWCCVEINLNHRLLVERQVGGCEPRALSFFYCSGSREFSVWLSARGEEEGAQKKRGGRRFLAAGVRYACQSRALLFGHERIHAKFYGPRENYTANCRRCRVPLSASATCPRSV
jgi:hypothetical protein